MHRRSFLNLRESVWKGPRRSHCWEGVQLVEFVHKFIPMPQAMKIPNAKAAVDKEWEKLQKLPANDLGEEQKKGGCSSGSTRRAKNRPFCFADGHLSSQKSAEYEPKYEKYKGQVVLRNHCERRFRLTRCIHGTRFLCISNDGHKSNGNHCKITRLSRTKQPTQYQLALKYNGGRSKIAQNSMDTSSDDHNFKEEELENCPKCSLKLSWNARIWPELVDRAFFGPCTNFQEQSQNGQEPVTDA